jgi:hypothetical protein
LDPAAILHDALEGAFTMDKAGPLPEAEFELTFSPSLALVSTVRRFVSEFYAETIGDPEIASKLALATHELLDNGARYSLDGRSSLRIRLERTPKDVAVTIETRNRAVDAHLSSARVALDELAAAPDADAHYQILMRRSATRVHGSGLGLGRIRAEGDMAVSYRIEADVLELRAEARFAAGGAS